MTVVAEVVDVDWKGEGLSVDVVVVVVEPEAGHPEGSASQNQRAPKQIGDSAERHPEPSPEAVAHFEDIGR